MRNLRIVGLSFIPVVLGGTIAVIALSSGWDDRDDSLATIGLAVTLALSILGLLFTLRWRNATTEGPVPAARLTTSYFLTLALAETPLLAGFVFAIVARDAASFWVGAGSFSISLILILTALGFVEIQGDGTPTRLIR